MIALIAKEKYKIISRHGSPVTVKPPSGSSYETKALVGRATQLSSSTISLESTRRGYFLPDVDINNGHIIENYITGDTYLAIARYPEVYNGKILSVALIMYVCNAVVDIYGVTDSYDEYGNRTQNPNPVVTDAPCYIQRVSADLRRYDPGLHEDAEDVIYLQGCEAGLMDTIEIKNVTPTKKVKAVDINNYLFEGVTRIQVKSETRNA